ncbi:serine hydrolase [Massilibacterium senegalense]|uniref:serine hydrolase n=1 Tax=Massilibacterium senegalense TaxID=1632858 RepID=UPI0007831578
MNLKWLIMTIIFALLSTIIIQVPTAKAADTAGFDVAAEAALLVDAKTGKILYQKNIDAELAPASMTKMMSEYLVLEAIKEGKLKWNQKVTISEYAHNISQNRSLSNVPLRIDDTYTVKELFEAMAIYSANGATIALAEAVAGSEPKFVDMMNKKAKEMGMPTYKFVNSSGLNNSDLLGKHYPGSDVKEENMMSARSTAILAYNLLKNYPEVLETTSTPKKVFREGTDDAIKMENWNWMLPELIVEYNGVDGLKTGSTDLAGYNFTGTAKRGDMRLISVVMKTNSHLERFRETAKLMDYGFNNFVEKEIIAKNKAVKGHETVNVVDGVEKEVNVKTKESFGIVVKKGEEDLYKPVFYEKKVVAPLKKGETVAYVGAKYKGTETYEFLTKDLAKKERVALVTNQEVEEAGFVRKAWRSFTGWVGDGWDSLVKTVKGWF